MVLSLYEGPRVVLSLYGCPRTVANQSGGKWGSWIGDVVQRHVGRVMGPLFYPYLYLHGMQGTTEHLQPFHATRAAFCDGVKVGVDLSTGLI